MAAPTPTADGVRPAEPTVERTQKFFDLLEEVGVGDLLDQALQAAPKKTSGKSDWTKTEAAPEPPEEEIEFDLGPMFLAVMRAGAVGRLAEIVLDGTPEQIAAAPMSSVRDGLSSFARASMELVGVLLGFGAGLASPTRRQAETETLSAPTSS